jgi:hypothetical protein
MNSILANAAELRSKNPLADSRRHQDAGKTHLPAKSAPAPKSAPKSTSAQASKPSQPTNTSVGARQWQRDPNKLYIYGNTDYMGPQSAQIEPLVDQQDEYEIPLEILEESRRLALKHEEERKCVQQQLTTLLNLRELEEISLRFERDEEKAAAICMKMTEYDPEIDRCREILGIKK